MTEAQTHKFANLGADECDHYKGKHIFAKHVLIDYDFVRHFDSMASDGKKQYTDRRPAILIHDFNNYEHGDGSGHYGNPYNNGKCVAVDYRWRGLSLYEGLMLDFKWRFDGIFVYPFNKKGDLSKVPFIHDDWKTWDRHYRTINFGFRNLEGKMISCNGNFDVVLQLIAMLPVVLNNN